jgi:chitinase
MDVRQIDTTKYSHIHFAFLDLTTAFDVDTSQFQDSFNNFVALTGVKRVVSFLIIACEPPSRIDV